MFDVGTHVATPDGPGTVIEYVRQQIGARGEYVERPAVLLHDGTLKAFAEDELTVEV